MGAALREFYNSLLSKMIVVPDQQDRLWVEVTVLAAGREAGLAQMVTERIILQNVPEHERRPRALAMADEMLDLVSTAFGSASEE